MYIIAETKKKASMKNMGKQMGEMFVFPDQFFTNTICIIGSISNDIADKVVKELDFLARFHKTIIVFIESDGGDFFAAKKIYDKLLELTRKNIETIGIATGDLSSISGFMFQGFSSRIISNGTEMLVHNLKEEMIIGYIPHVHSRKKTHGIVEGMINESYAVQKLISFTLSIVSGMSEKKVAKLLLQKPILDSGQIMEYGFADKILSFEQILEFRSKKEVCIP